MKQSKTNHKIEIKSGWDGGRKTNEKITVDFSSLYQELRNLKQQVTHTKTLMLHHVTLVPLVLDLIKP